MKRTDEDKHRRRARSANTPDPLPKKTTTGWSTSTMGTGRIDFGAGTRTVQSEGVKHLVQPNGVRHLQRAERCPPVEGTPVALFMELLHCPVIIYVQLSGRRVMLH